MRRALFLALVSSLGCSKVVVDGPIGPNGRPCPQGQACPSGPNGGAVSYQPGKDQAVAAAEIATSAACARLYSDCRSLCTNPFVNCGTSLDQCTQDLALSAVENKADPFSSPQLAQTCADQIAMRSCEGLDPGTANCDEAVVEGCPGDAPDSGFPYSWYAAIPLDTLPATLDRHLCADVKNYFSLALNAGDKVKVTLEDSPGGFWIFLYAPKVGRAGSADVEQLGAYVLGASPSTKTEFTFNPVASSGTFYLALQLIQGTAEVKLSVGTETQPPPTAQANAVDTAKLVYSALCRRLHGDCSAGCGAADIACGASESDCTDAFAHAAIELLQGRNANAPVLDPAAAMTCATQVAAASCGALDPGTPECMGILAHPCPQDPNGWAHPYSWRLAPALGALPGMLSLNVCEHASQWFRVDLSQGEKLSVGLAAAPSVGWVNLMDFSPDTTADDRRTSSHWLESTALSETAPDVLMPAPVAGTYYLNFDHVSGSGPVQISIARN